MKSYHLNISSPRHAYHNDLISRNAHRILDELLHSRNLHRDITYPAYGSTFALRTTPVADSKKNEVGARSTPIRKHASRRAGELRIFWTILLTDCSSRRHCCRCCRRRRNLAKGCNSRRGCFSATRIGRDGRGTRWTRRDGTKGIAESTRDECESSQPAAPPMAIPGGPPANCSCCKLRAVFPPIANDDERLRLPFSRISTIHTRHDLPVQVTVSNNHSRFPDAHPTLR